MVRETPSENLAESPCLIVAVSCAVGSVDGLRGRPKLKADGYATLASANRWIRENLDVKKRTDYKRGERPKLKDLRLDGQAVACVLGHYVYVNRETYWSFFDNENDETVAVWELKKQG